MIIWFFLFKFVYMVYHVDRFSCVKPFLQPRDEAYLDMVDDFSDIFLDSVCQYFIEYFCFVVNQGYWSVVFFLICIFVRLGYQGDCGLVERVW